MNEGLGLFNCLLFLYVVVKIALLVFSYCEVENLFPIHCGRSILFCFTELATLVIEETGNIVGLVVGTIAGVLVIISGALISILLYRKRFNLFPYSRDLYQNLQLTFLLFRLLIVLQDEM